jgi:nitroreductase
MRASDVTTTVPDHQTLLTVMRLAGRAPSVHNMQPWHWVFDGTRLHLYTDPDRLLPATDPHGRQQVISCGAALHHVRTVFAAHGWHTDTVRMPDPQRPDYLAVLGFRPWPDPPAEIAVRARAIGHRHTDRRPMLEPSGWGDLVPALRRLVASHDLEFDVVGDEVRPQLAAVSEHAAAARRHDMMYQDELQWWTGHPGVPDGVPPSALPSAAESARVDIGRSFSYTPHSERCAAITDRSTLVVLSSYDESVLQWLHTGEALSAVLLECTAAGLMTCPLTHITELPAGRRVVASMLPHSTVPQVLIRVGTAAEDSELPQTPRRPLTDILDIR